MPEQSYTCVKPFDLTYLYIRNFPPSAFIALLKEKIFDFSSFEDIQSSLILMRNLDWLESKNLIKKKPTYYANVYLTEVNQVYLGTKFYSSVPDALTKVGIDMKNPDDKFLMTTKLN